MNYVLVSKHRFLVSSISMNERFGSVVVWSLFVLGEREFFGDDDDDDSMRYPRGGGGCFGGRPGRSAWF